MSNFQKNLKHTERIGFDMWKLYEELGPEEFGPVFISAYLGVAEMMVEKGTWDKAMGSAINQQMGVLVQKAITDWKKSFDVLVKVKQEHMKAKGN